MGETEAATEIVAAASSWEPPVGEPAQAEPPRAPNPLNTRATSAKMKRSSPTLRRLWRLRRP